ncbi:uncharacterized protein LOC123208679 [Mangifera indica]|uniref:uncharacterized protein LOC123208679 n=1 Tax=Mangifera indica TaxID=29780 RepID=UPI001CFA2C82|nr:uncharacterized protein LOC123208679 [Mangifera indica]
MVFPPQVFEIRVNSAHDLALVSKSMKTYVTVSIDSNRKVTTRVDQTGLNNPTWNEKFGFRVDDRFLNDETSVVMVEIYAAAWLKDYLIGSVRVLITHLFGSVSNNALPTRFVALQVRPLSGRPQGIINMGISLLDNTTRSLPLLAELCAAGGAFSDITSIRNYNDAKTKKTHKDDQEVEKLNLSNNPKKNLKLRRSLSDRTDLTSKDNRNQVVVNVDSIMCNDLVLKGNNNNNNNGGVVNESICWMDVGPSASVVAAAIAKGLYKTPAPAANRENEENLKLNVERWRNEDQPNYNYYKMKANSKQSGHARRRTESGGLFSCFGNAFGCEISITCGGGGAGSTQGRYQNCRIYPLSMVGDSICSVHQPYVARFKKEN